MSDTAMRTMLEEAGGEQVDDPGLRIDLDVPVWHHAVAVSRYHLQRETTINNKKGMRGPVNLSRPFA